MLLVILLIIYPLFMNFLGGTALIYEAYDNMRMSLLEEADFRRFCTLGVMMLVSSLLFTVSTVLCIRKKDIPAVVIETSGIILCMAVVLTLRKIALESGLSNDELKPYADIYMERHIPTIAHSIVLYIISFASYFSYENKVKRNMKKDKDGKIEQNH